MPSLEVLALFIACVALASVVQNLTAFAFSLVLIGLVELFGLIDLHDVVNVATVLSLINTVTFLRTERTPTPWRLMRPALVTGIAGTVIGVALLGSLAFSTTNWLRLLLGCTILGSALTMLIQQHQRAQVSPPLGFAAAGLVSGLLGGLFSASGPPIVYHLYRQPLEIGVIRKALVLMFTFISGLRLVLVLASGLFSRTSMLLCLIAIPVVLGTTHFCARHPPAISRERLRRVVALLLALAGLSLLLSSLRPLLAA